MKGQLNWGPVVISIVLVLGFLVASPKDQRGEVERLKVQVAALEQRIQTLENKTIWRFKP